MIGRLRGMLATVRPEAVLVDVGGVGYEVAMTASAMEDLPPIGEEIVIHTHLHVREDVSQLYGFTHEADRALFRTLLTASGVGPKLAMAVLSTLSADAVRQAVSTEDVDALTLVPGIGKRSAQKIILELRPKLEGVEADLASSPGSIAEVREALERLGYQSREIREVLAGLPAGEPVEGLLRMALQELGRK